MSIGIKESLEVVTGLEVVGVAGIGLVKAEDMGARIAIGLELLKSSEKIVEAVKGVDQIDEEIKDLSQEELIQLGLAAFGMVKKLAAAAKSKEEAV